MHLTFWHVFGGKTQLWRAIFSTYGQMMEHYFRKPIYFFLFANTYIRVCIGTSKNNYHNFGQIFLLLYTGLLHNILLCLLPIQTPDDLYCWLMLNTLNNYFIHCFAKIRRGISRRQLSAFPGRWEQCTQRGQLRSWLKNDQIPLHLWGKCYCAFQKKKRIRSKENDNEL